MAETDIPETFLRELRTALRHLYDPAELRKSPLIPLLHIPVQPDAAAALRKTLLEAIQSLKPGSKVSVDSTAWRTHRLLTYRFIEQSGQKEVAADLALSIRQLRRLENAAILRLAEALLELHQLPLENLRPLAAEAQNALPGESAPGQAQELDWLKKSYSSETVDLRQLIQTCLVTIEPLLRAGCVEVRSELAADLPRALGQMISLRQVLLNVLTTAVRCGAGNQVWVEANAAYPGILVQVRAAQGTRQPLARDSLDALGLARQLAELTGGSLEVGNLGRGKPFIARLFLQQAEQIGVLVIDDNEDTLRLFERYLSGSRYSFLGTRDPVQALALASEHQPHVIVLDVMLPGIDGWELLGRFREHPRLCRVPVIVSTILPQETLALALGAAGFIRKPVGREAFLAALDQQVGSFGRESSIAL